MASAIDKQAMLDLIIEAKRTDTETGSFAEWLAEYLIKHLPTLPQISNNPLTLEQLRKMDGEPVWCEWLLDVDRGTEHGAWFIVVVGKYGLELKKPLDFGCHVC